MIIVTFVLGVVCGVAFSRTETGKYLAKNTDIVIDRINKWVEQVKKAFKDLRKK